MTKSRRPLAHYVFYGVILLMVASVIGLFMWVGEKSYINTVTPYFTSLSCIEGVSTQSCSIDYRLYNNSDERVLTDLNGINGPGFAESHISDVIAVLDDGTSVNIHAGSDMDFDSHIGPHETVELSDTFTIPLHRHVVTIKILRESYPINN